ncbi:hypothetical protein CYMTET_28714 [Cymbomonas tetramitiformis]|uniref:Uncharacterized protein n=1 Tax=Cymbomonas tetramitiformis TaxID=36881 RepID=A0AAE0FME6_9CHLO|nr:hypothetical protein CYMTET_28714 [Cymbomonas tetramitiformis]
MEDKYDKLYEHPPVTPESLHNLASGAVDFENGIVEVLGANGQPEDVLDLQTEEMFTLETYGSLIQDHMEEKKNFIIARATSRDKESPRKTRWSYYSAHHLNKVLFRWNAQNELIHRYMRSNTLPPAINPATNSEVVGEIEYFIVSALRDNTSSIGAKAKQTLRGRSASENAVQPQARGGAAALSNAGLSSPASTSSLPSPSASSPGLNVEAAPCKGSSRPGKSLALQIEGLEAPEAGFREESSYTAGTSASGAVAVTEAYSPHTSPTPEAGTSASGAVAVTEAYSPHTFPAPEAGTSASAAAEAAEVRLPRPPSATRPLSMPSRPGHLTVDIPEEIEARRQDSSALSVRASLTGQGTPGSDMSSPDVTPQLTLNQPRGPLVLVPSRRAPVPVEACPTILANRSPEFASARTDHQQEIWKLLQEVECMQEGGEMAGDDATRQAAAWARAQGCTLERPPSSSEEGGTLSLGSTWDAAFASRGAAVELHDRAPQEQASAALSGNVLDTSGPAAFPGGPWRHVSGTARTHHSWQDVDHEEGRHLLPKVGGQGAGGSGVSGRGGLPFSFGLKLQATFLCTDYNFAFSESIRKVFAESSIDAGHTGLRTLEAAAPGEGPGGGGGGEPGENHLMMALARWAPQLSEAIERASSTGQQVIDVPYSRAVVFGSMGSLYVLTSFLIFSVALMHLSSSQGSSRKGDWYWSFLPFFSFTTDRFIAIIFLEQEERTIMALKFVMWTFYVVFPTLVFPPNEGTAAHMVCRDVLDIIFPLIFLMYSCVYYIQLSRKKRLC